MDAGVTVIAAAPGIVAGLRDGMEDRLFAPGMGADLAGRDCGNRVVVDHGGPLGDAVFPNAQKGPLQAR